MIDLVGYDGVSDYLLLFFLRGVFGDQCIAGALFYLFDEGYE